MNYNIRRIILRGVAALFLWTGIIIMAMTGIGGIGGIGSIGNITATAAETETAQEAIPTGIIIPAPATSKNSSQAIRISWSSSQDDAVKRYYVMRRETVNSEGAGKWKTIAKVNSDGIKNGPKNFYIDQLDSSDPQQYEYKICTLSKDGAVDTRKSEYAAETNNDTVLGTNIKICIDPGHFGTRNNNYDYTGANGEFPYSEAKFTLKIGKALQADLKEQYGIDSYMTRTTSKISLMYEGKKYTNKKLDDNNIKIRGYMAKVNDCDFFISLHTNARGQAKKPWNQPESINKVYVFVNKSASTHSLGMRIANSIGLNVTACNQEIGIQEVGFTTRSKKQAIAYKDLSKNSDDPNGTVVYREGSEKEDYYGVLRGANEVGVQGMIVEHAFHDTKVMREQANASNGLYESWAAADAYGIAYGFGFMDKRKQTLVREQMISFGEEAEE